MGLCLLCFYIHRPQGHICGLSAYVSVHFCLTRYEGPCNHVESFCCYKCSLLNILAFPDFIFSLLDEFTGPRVIGASVPKALFFISSASQSRSDAQPRGPVWARVAAL